MSTMAKYARIFWTEPKDQDVAARNESVSNLQDQFATYTSKASIRLAEALVSALSTGKLPEDVAGIVETAISEKSPAFVLSQNEQQGAVCAAVAALELVRTAPKDEGARNGADVLAASLWSATALQSPLSLEPIEALRVTLMEACRERVQEVATLSRKRQHVPDVGTLTIPEEDPAGSKAQSAYKRATTPVIKALKENADLDREELDFLWWVLADYSNVLESPLAAKEMFNRAIAAGIEAASMLRRLPTDGHRHVTLRLVESTDAITLPEVLDQISADKVHLSRKFKPAVLAETPTVFPLLSALANGDEAKPSSIKLNAREWGARALLEAGIYFLNDRLSGSK